MSNTSPYLNIIGIWWHVNGILIPGIALVADPHRPKNSSRKIFLIDFDGPKYDFFCFLENMAELCNMVNMDFLGAFRGPKYQFPAKYHISGHYVTKYGFLKSCIFGDFLMILLIFQF